MSSTTQSVVNPPGDEGGQPAKVTVNQTDYDERIRVLQGSLADVQKPETLKHRTGRNLLAHAELMFDILDAIKDLHSFIAVATLPFRATLKIILVKQDNDKRIAALMIEMIDMMSALIDLRSIKDTHLKTATGESVEGNLNRVLTVIKNDIQEAGNLVDCYSKANSWHRVLRVRDWAERFKDMAQTFQKDKSNIQAALGTHTALSVDSLHPKIDHVLVLMQEWFEHPHSADERTLLERVKEEERRKYLDNEAAFITLYKDAGSGERGRESASGTLADKRTDDNKAKLRQAKEEWEELKKPLATYLDENRTMFEALLAVQKRDLAAVIRQSETTIISAIHEGPHSYITHPDIRNLWKAMQWRLSVKTRHFVMALHDYYLHGAFAASSRGTTDTTSPTVPLPQESDFEGAASVNPADRWCLQYLRIRYLPAISEAFDDDGSGFIRISEVNEFTEGIPKGWNLLNWVAYWTGSWPRELVKYSRLIQEVMVQLAEAQCMVKPENIEYVNDYMNGFAFSETKLLVSSIQPRVTSASGKFELHRLAAEMKSQTEKYLKDNLATVKYNIDGPDRLPLLCGPGRVEKYLFPLLYLVLERHLEIVRFASTHALDSREMAEADTSLYNVLEKVFQRVDELKESFRQQKLDVNEIFKSFACGIYSRYHYSNARKGIGLLPQPPNPDTIDNSSDGYEGSASDAEAGSEEPSGQGDQAIEPPNEPISPVHDETAPVNQEDLALVKDSGETLVDDSNMGSSDPAMVVADPATVVADPATVVADPATVVAGSASTSQTGLPAEEKSPSPAQDISPVSELDASNKPDDPTRFGPFVLKTALYEEPSTLTEDTAPWRPLDVHYSDVGPREMFRMAGQRVLERVQLLSPRLTWAYLQRRRSIRLRWIEVKLRPEQQYFGVGQYKDWEPSDEEELACLGAQVTPADVSYYDSLSHLQFRLQMTHWEYHCDGCKSHLLGKRFRCLDCPMSNGFDLCNECEYADIPRHNVEQHPSSHTMLQYSYPVMNWLPCQTFETRGRNYIIKHSKQPCPCCNAESMATSDATTTPLRCSGCQKEMRNEVHFRCLQCPDYDLCASCEEDHPPQHCRAHVLLKLQAPFLERDTDATEIREDDEQPLSVEARLVLMTKRLTDLETKMGSRLDELQKGFTRVVSLLEHAGTQEKRRETL